MSRCQKTDGIRFCKIPSSVPFVPLIDVVAFFNCWEGVTGLGFLESSPGEFLLLMEGAKSVKTAKSQADAQSNSMGVDHLGTVLEI